MANAIETEGLTKSFRTTRALAGVDLAIREGTVYGLLGGGGRMAKARPRKRAKTEPRTGS